MKTYTPSSELHRAAELAHFNVLRLHDWQLRRNRAFRMAGSDNQNARYRKQGIYTVQIRPGAEDYAGDCVMPVNPPKASNPCNQKTVLAAPQNCAHGPVWCGPGAFGPCMLSHRCEFFEHSYD